MRREGHIEVKTYQQKPSWISWLMHTQSEHTEQNRFGLTESAGHKIASLLEAEKKPYFRVSVDGGGCSGFQYKFDFETTRTDTDLEFSNHGVTVLVDDMSIEFLENAELDYVEELIGSFFTVNNPNATANCGCGTSFSV